MTTPPGDSPAAIRPGRAQYTDDANATGLRAVGSSSRPPLPSPPAFTPPSDRNPFPDSSARSALARQPSNRRRLPFVPPAPLAPCPLGRTTSEPQQRTTSPGLQLPARSLTVPTRTRGPRSPAASPSPDPTAMAFLNATRRSSDSSSHHPQQPQPRPRTTSATTSGSSQRASPSTSLSPHSVQQRPNAESSRSWSHPLGANPSTVARPPPFAHSASDSALAGGQKPERSLEEELDEVMRRSKDEAEVNAFLPIAHPKRELTPQRSSSASASNRPGWRKSDCCD